MIVVGVLMLFWGVVPLIPREHQDLGTALLVATAVVALAAARVVWRRPAVSVDVPLVCVGLAALSLLLATRGAPERFGPVEPWRGATTGWAHALFFLGLWWWLPTREEEPDGADTARGLALLLGTVLGLQLVGALLELEGGEAQRASGYLGNPNVFGAFVGAAALALGALGRWRPFTWPVLGLALAALLASRSRGAVVATAAVVLVFAARRGGRVVLGVGVAMAILLVVVPNPLSERLENLQPEHVFSRPFLWSAAVEGIVEEPLGVGAGMNRHVFPLRAHDPEHPWLLHQRHGVGLTHNVFLTLWLEWGWLAGAALVALTLWALVNLWPRRGPDPASQAATLAAGVLAAELQVDGLEQNPVVFTIFLAVLAVALRRCVPRRRDGRLPGRVVAVVLGLAGLAALAGAGHRAQAFLALRGAERTQLAWQAGQAPWAAVEAAWEAAVTAAPGHAAPVRRRALLATTRLRQDLDRGRIISAELPAEVARVRDLWDRALAVAPADVRAREGLVELELLAVRRGGRRPEDVARYRGAVESLLAADPLHVDARRGLAAEARRDGDLALMVRLLEELFALEPDDARAWLELAGARELGGDREGALYALVRCEEAVHNARVKAAVDDPASRDYYLGLLHQVDLVTVRRRLAALRREILLPSSG